MLVLQIHFVTTGKPEKCKIRVGLKYASGEVKKQLRFFLFDGRRFTIPPQEPAHPIAASFVLDRDAIGIGMFAHMHLRGKAMTFRAKPPDRETETLLMIPNFSFDWQIPYVWEKGVKKLPKGTKLDCVGLYDNSAFNAYNPAPDSVVRSGQQTYHEMMNGFLFYVDANEDMKLDIDAIEFASIGIRAQKSVVRSAPLPICFRHEDVAVNPRDAAGAPFERFQLRRDFFPGRADHRHLLPSIVSGAPGESGERRILRHRSRSSLRWLSAVQALPADDDRRPAARLG
jgi:hypothetical protein